MAATLCSTIPLITTCSCHSGTKIAIRFSGPEHVRLGVAEEAAAERKRRFNHAQAQTRSRARSSIPLMSKASADGNRHAARQLSNRARQDVITSNTYGSSAGEKLNVAGIFLEPASFGP